MLDLPCGVSRCCDGVSRRSFVRAGVLGMAGFGLADLLRLRASAAGGGPIRAKAVILVWMHGGPSQLETYDPKPDAPSEVRGPFSSIPSNVPGLRLGDKLPLHAKMMDKVAILRGYHHGNSDHWAAAHWVLTGHVGPNGANRAAKNPSIGSVVSKLKGPNRSDVPALVNFNDGGFGYHGATYLGVAHNPLQTGDDSYGNEAQPLPATGPSSFRLPEGVDAGRFGDRRKLLQSFDNFRRDVDQEGTLDGLDAFERRAMEMVLSGRTRKAFDLADEDAATRELYGPGWGEQALLARRLVEAGVTFVTLNTGYWDDHKLITPKLENKLPRHDRMMSALINDLDRRGLLADTLVVAAGEFGRTPRINKFAGRDHWPDAGSILLAGGGIKGGTVIGATDRKGERPTEAPVSPNDLGAIIYQALGINPETVINDANDRPHALLPGGRVPEGLT